MNKEAVFALRFVMKDFAKMRKGIEQMNKNLAQMRKTANDSSRGIDKVNNSMGKATRSVLKFAAAYFSLSKIIGTVFAKADEAIQLNLMARSAGVLEKQIGKLGKALIGFGGDARTAGSAYASLTNIIGGAQHGMGVSEDVMRVNSMFGIGFNYGNISQDELITEIARAMKTLRKKGDQWGINQIASAYGLDSSLAELLATYGTGWKKFASAQEYAALDPKKARELAKQKADLQTNLDNAIIQLAPAVSDVAKLIQEATPYLKDIAEILNSVFGWYIRTVGNAKEAGESTGEDTASLLEPMWRANWEKTHKPLTEEQIRQSDKNLLNMGHITEKQFYALPYLRKAKESVEKGTMSWNDYNALRVQNGFPTQENTINIKLENSSSTPLKAVTSVSGSGRNEINISGNLAR